MTLSSRAFFVKPAENGAAAKPRLLVLLAVALLPLVPSLAAQTPSPLPSGGAHYTIFQGTKPLGDAQYAVASIAGGYTLTSSGHMTLAKFSYGFHNEATLDASLNLVRDTLTGSVNGTKAHGNNISFNTASDATGRDFQMSVSANGKQTSNTVDRHRNTVLVPDLDPAAYMLMVHFTLEQVPTAWAIIPKENGLLVPAAYDPKDDVRGTLNGADINVKHVTAVLSDTNAITLELYYTPDGKLLESDLNAQNLYVVRDGFKLAVHPAPTPPPPGQVPQKPGEQAPQGQ
jgi:hypothetical protein